METPGDFSDAGLKTSGHATSEPYPYLEATDPRPEGSRGGHYTGAKVAYERVIVVENYRQDATVKAPTGYKVMDFYSSADVENTAKYGQIDRSWRRGQLKAAKLYNSSNRVVAEERYEYEFKKTGDVAPRIAFASARAEQYHQDWGMMEYGLVRLTAKTTVRDGVARTERFAFADAPEVTECPSDEATGARRTLEPLGDAKGRLMLETRYVDIGDGQIHLLFTANQTGSACVYRERLYACHILTGSMHTPSLPYFSRFYVFSMPLGNGVERQWDAQKAWSGQGIQQGLFEGGYDLATCKIGHFGGGASLDLLCVVRTDAGTNRVKVRRLTDVSWGRSTCASDTWKDVPVPSDFTACCFLEPDNEESSTLIFIYPHGIRVIRFDGDEPVPSGSYTGVQPLISQTVTVTGVMYHEPRAVMADYDSDGRRNDLLVTVGYELAHVQDAQAGCDDGFITLVYRNISLQGGGVFSPPAYSYEECIWEDPIRTKSSMGGEICAIVFAPGTNERIYTFASGQMVKADASEFGLLWALKSRESYVYDFDGQANRMMECDGTGAVLRTTSSVPAFEKYPQMKSLHMLTQAFAQKTYEGQVSGRNVRAAQVTTWAEVQGGGSSAYMPQATYTWRAVCDGSGMPLNPDGTPVNVEPQFNIGQTATNPAWVRGDLVTAYTAKGNAVETMAATGMYTTTVLDRHEIHILATAANARYGECLFTSFEEQPIGIFTDRVGPGAQAAIMASQHHAGSKCLSLSKKATGDPYYLSDDTPLNSELPSEGEKKICWEFWAKASSDQVTSGFTHLQTCDAASSLHGGTYFELTTQWRKYRFEATVPYAKLRQRFHVVLRPPRRKSDGQYVDGTIYYDDVRAYPADGLMTCAVHHPVLQQPTWTSDANNNWSETRYDGFGRVKAEYNTAGLKVREYEYGEMISPCLQPCEGGGLNILNPVGGERYIWGQQVSIRWEMVEDECGERPQVSKVKIELTTDGGTNWTGIASDVANVSPYTYAWTVPSNVSSSRCNVRVTSTQGPTLTDATYPFTIVQDATPARVLLVDKKLTTGADDGSTWLNAFRGEGALERALDRAEELNPTDGNEVQIWVARAHDGEPYLPSQHRNDDDPRSRTFTLRPYVKLYGGFNGGGTELFADRQPAVYETVLSGDFNGDDGADYTNYGENAYSVVIGADNAVIDGFTITHGCARTSPTDDCHGAGMSNVGVSPRIQSCTFLDNYASIIEFTGHGYSAHGTGAGIHNWQADPIIANCTFIGNYATQGAGISNYHSSPAITGCYFFGNEAEIGGAIVNGGATQSRTCSPTLKNCVIAANVVNGLLGICAGGGMYSQYADVSVVNCTVARNLSYLIKEGEYAGGGFTNDIGAILTIVNCIIWGNQDEIYNIQGGTATCSYSDIRGSGGSGDWVAEYGTDGGNNIDEDPVFDGDGDHISSASPCIDRGNDYVAPELDKDNNARIDIANVGVPGTESDIGAYEYTP